MTRCSICIPAYNESEYITDCVVAAAADAGPNDEILVGDDASTDDTAAKVAQLADTIENVRLYSWAENVGQLATSQRLAERASGRYMIRVDADSNLRPGTVSAVCNQLANGAGVVYGKVSVANTEHLHPAACQLGKERGRANWHGGGCIGVERQAFMVAGGFEAMRQNVERELMFKAEGRVERLDAHGVESNFPVAWREWLPRKFNSGRVYLEECRDSPERFDPREVRGPAFWAGTAVLLATLPKVGLLAVSLFLVHHARDQPAIKRLSGKWSVAIAYPGYKLISGVARAVGVWTRLPTLLWLVAQNIGGDHAGH